MVMVLVCGGLASCGSSGDSAPPLGDTRRAATPEASGERPRMPGNDESPGDDDESPRDDDENPGDDRLFQVSGTVTRGGLPVAGVAATIKGFDAWSTQTGPDGSFAIPDVTKGEYELSLSEQDGGRAFGALTRPITVTKNLEFAMLTLPQPVALDSPSEISEDAMRLSWTPSESASFREYKLYRADGSGLDETTGTLLHVGTSLADTTFLDEDLQGNKEYFYRVFVLDEYGLLGGSNIISATTLDPCTAQPPTAEIFEPIAGATGVSTDVLVRFKWTPPDLTDRYAGMQAETGIFSVPEDDGTTNGEEWARYSLGPNTEYTFEIGWYCTASAEQQNIPLASVTFTTGP
jgi:hypothetical protein